MLLDPLYIIKFLQLFFPSKRQIISEKMYDNFMITCIIAQCGKCGKNMFTGLFLWKKKKQKKQLASWAYLLYNTNVLVISFFSYFFFGLFENLIGDRWMDGWRRGEGTGDEVGHLLRWVLRQQSREQCV